MTVAKKTVRTAAKPAAKSSRTSLPKQAAIAEAAGIAVRANYDAAGMGRRMRGWNPPASGPNRTLKGLQNIRNRSRDTARNDWSGASGIQHWTTNLIGTGIVPRPKRVKAKGKKQRLIERWDQWVAEADADSVLNWYAMQTLATRSWLEAGEVFVRRRDRRFDSGLSTPMQVQLLEAEFVPVFDADSWPGMPAGHRIRQGIELNRIGKRVAYWMHREHPGDNFTGTIDNSMLVRVAASQVIHIFEPKRPGQMRGVPDFAPILARLRNVADFDDAVLERQKLANLFTMFIRKPANWGGTEQIDPLTGMPIVYDNSGPIAALEAGTSHELLPGEEVQFSNPPEAGTTYDSYMRTQHLGTSAGQGLPYEIMSGDIKEVSDRTLRVILNEFRRYAEQRQWQIIIPMFCQRCRDWWVEANVLIGEISMADAENARLVEWSPQGWPYIHPVQDVQAKAQEVELGSRSLSSVIAERGDDPETVMDEREADMKALKQRGLYQEPQKPGAANSGKPGESDGIAPGEYPRNSARDARLQREQAEATNLLLTAQAKFYATGGPQPPVVNITNQLPSTTVQNNVAVEPTPVTVQNTVEPTPVTVQNTVEPTPVTVQNTVAVEPTPVTVMNDVKPADVNVSLPARKTQTSVVRDANGNIVSATQVETDLDEPSE